MVRAVRVNPRRSSAYARTVSGSGLALAATKSLRIVVALIVVVLALGTSDFWPLWLLTPACLLTAATALSVDARSRGAVFLTWMLYLTGFTLFKRLRMMMHFVPMPTQYDYVIEADRALFQGVVPTVWLQQHWYVPGQIDALVLGTVAVHLSYFFVVHVVAVAIWRSRPQWLLRYTLAVLGTLYLGLVGYALVPTAPPWLAAHLGHLPEVTRILPAVLTSYDPRIYETGHLIVGRHDVGAMPSLHLAITAVIALALIWMGHARPGARVALRRGDGFLPRLHG